MLEDDIEEPNLKYYYKTLGSPTFVGISTKFLKKFQLSQFLFNLLSSDKEKRNFGLMVIDFCMTKKSPGKLSISRRHAQNLHFA